MPSISDILSAEKSRTDQTQKRTIFFHPDGSFYRAYEWSAWLCVRYLRQFKVTRRKIKSIDSDMVFVGFPKTSLEKFQIEGSELDMSDENSITLTLPEQLVSPEPDSTLDEDFQNWRITIPLSENKSSRKDRIDADASQPMSMTGIMKKIMSFSVENNSPIDCMLFLAEIKKEIAVFL